MFLYYSILGHSVSDLSLGNIYSITKHSVTALTEGLRKELTQLKSKIKITSISPGAVKTEIADKIQISKEMFEMMKNLPMLEPKDVRFSHLYLVNASPYAGILLTLIVFRFALRINNY
ncbi:hypothetical protein PR048_002553 [Dryococelus australis]|uniref:Uncharacterized protein n=1 Tax=Dryococelus australis TaxID=614101 RepID=A0ABQ9IKM7_9NEOP|nr:hypothetical protein PR048_002553 [Dryococelus australis]